MLDECTNKELQDRILGHRYALLTRPSGYGDAVDAPSVSASATTNISLAHLFLVSVAAGVTVGILNRWIAKL